MLHALDALGAQDGGERVAEDPGLGERLRSDRDAGFGRRGRRDREEEDGQGGRDHDAQAGGRCTP